MSPPTCEDYDEIRLQYIGLFFTQWLYCKFVLLFTWHIKVTKWTRTWKKWKVITLILGSQGMEWERTRECT